LRFRQKNTRCVIHYSNTIKGIVRGKTIELDQALGLPDGQTVAVTVVASAPAGDGLRRAFGSWAEDGTELDEFLKQVRLDRKQQREQLPS
jgi:hypothetical protein